MLQTNFFKEDQNFYHMLFRLKKCICSWKCWAVFVLVLCFFVQIFRYILPIEIDNFLFYFFCPASIGIFALLLYTCPYVKYPEVKLLGSLAVWMVLTIVFNRARAPIVLSNIWLCKLCLTTFLCFSLPYAFCLNDVRKTAASLAVAMVGFISVLCILGLFSVLAKEIPPNIRSYFDGLEIRADGRLGLNSHPNTGAAISGIALPLTGYLLVQTKRLPAKLVLLFGGIICYVTLSLTDSRTGIISTSIAIGLEAFLAANVILRKRKHALLRIALSAVAACLVTIALYHGTALVRCGYNQYAAIASVSTGKEDAKNDGMAAVDDASHEQDSPAPPVISRDLSDADSFNGRTDIWIGVLSGLFENPDILAIGTGPSVAGEVMAPYFPEGSPIGIFHNSFLGVLVAFGVPGLALLLILMILLMIKSLRLTFMDLSNPDTLAVRMMPAVLLFTVTESMMEDFLFVSSLNVVWVWFMFSAGFVFHTFKLIRQQRSSSPGKTA